MADDTYTTLSGERLLLSELDADEKSLVTELHFRAEVTVHWPEFAAYFMKRVGDFYLDRGLSRRDIVKLPIWRLAHDLKDRLAVKEGRPAPQFDYRDDLCRLVRAFPNRRAFCDATGVADETLGHVLAKKQHLPIDDLTGALERIGYRIQIVPVERVA